MLEPRVYIDKAITFRDCSEELLKRKEVRFSLNTDLIENFYGAISRGLNPQSLTVLSSLESEGKKYFYKVEAYIDGVLGNTKLVIENLEWIPESEYDKIMEKYRHAEKNPIDAAV